MEGEPGQPEQPEKPKQEPKPGQAFENVLVELVMSEASFSTQAGYLATLLQKKLNQDPPLKLSDADRNLLKKAQQYYQEFTKNPYPWFGPSYTPDKIRGLSFSAQTDLCHTLYEELQNNDSKTAKVINRRIEMMHWAAIHFNDLNNIINRDKRHGSSLLNLKTDKNYLLEVPGQAPQLNSEANIASNFLIPPIQRLPRIILLTEQLLKRAPAKQTDELNNLYTKWQIETAANNELVRIAEIENKEVSNLLKNLPLPKLPYVVPIIKKELERRESLVVQLEEAKESFEISKTERKTTAETIKERKRAVEDLENQIKEVDGIIVNKINALLMHSEDVLLLIKTELNKRESFVTELREAKNSLETFKSEETPEIIEEKKRAVEGIEDKIKEFDENFEEKINAFAKVSANERLSDKEQKIFGNPEFTLERLEDNEFKKLIASAYLHRREINLIYDKKNAPLTVQEIRLILDEDPLLPRTLKNRINHEAIKTLKTLPDKELELFAAPDPQFTSAFLKNNDLKKLTTAIYLDREKIRLVFGEEAYDNVNNLAKARSAISDETFGFFLDRNRQTMLASFLKQPDKLVDLTIDVRLHQTEIAELFNPEDYDYQAMRDSLQSANELIASNESDESDQLIAKALLTVSDKELELGKASNPKSILQNLSTRDLIDLTADVYVHQTEINALFGANNIINELKKNNDPKITNTLTKLAANEIHLFRWRIKTTFESLNTEDLGKLNFDVRTHRQELIFLFGKEAYQNVSKAFAEEYKNRWLTTAITETSKAIDELFANGKNVLTPNEANKYEKLLKKQVSLLNEKQTISIISHQDLDKLSDKEIKLFTAPPEDISKTLKTEAPNIDALTKLSKDIHTHRQEITKLFGEKAYQEMGKALVKQYQELKKPLLESESSRWSKYTHKEKAEAAGELFKAIETSAMTTLGTETKKILTHGKLGKIAKPLMEEAEKEKSTRHGPRGGGRP